MQPQQLCFESTQEGKRKSFLFPADLVSVSYVSIPHDQIAVMSYMCTFTLRALKNKAETECSCLLIKQEPMLGTQLATRPGSTLSLRDEIPGGAQQDPANLKIPRWQCLGGHGTSSQGCSAVMSTACAEHSPCRAHSRLQFSHHKCKGAASGEILSQIDQIFLPFTQTCRKGTDL